MTKTFLYKFKGNESTGRKPAHTGRNPAHDAGILARDVKTSASTSRISSSKSCPFDSKDSRQVGEPLCKNPVIFQPVPKALYPTEFF